MSDEEVAFGEQSVIRRICAALEVDEPLATKLLRKADLAMEKPDDNTRTLIEIVRPELNALTREIERGMIYAINESGGQGDISVFLIGSVARWQGAGKLLERIVNHPVQIVPNPLAPYLGAETEELDSPPAHPELAVATGLALRDFYHG